MASTYQRRQQWWVKFQHPGTKKIIRESLETSDASRAEILRRRIELEIALLDPRIRNLQLPKSILREIGIDEPTATPSHTTSISQMAMLPIAVAPVARVSIEEAAKAFLNYISNENAPETRANKVSMLRRFLGPKRAEKVIGPSKSATRFGKHRTKLGSEADVAFRGTFLDEVSTAVMLNFIEKLQVSTKTARHYREFFHRFFEVCMLLDLYRPSNLHRPNPAAALPSYQNKNQRIIYLKPADIVVQHQALSPNPAIQMAVDIMIHAGLRRAEVLWLTRDSIDQNLTFIKVLNAFDEDQEEEGSLKTGERPVTILPVLREALVRYLPTLKSEWLIPTPDGKRWSKDGFSRRLGTINRQHKLRWTCNIYRHTYATQRAAEGWPLFRIAREMGNSVAIVEKFYAAHIRPHEATLSITQTSAQTTPTSSPSS